MRSIERIKDAGNNLYKQKNYQGAYAKYTEGLGQITYNMALKAILLSNRALMLQKMGKESEAMVDLDMAIKCNKIYGKAYLKKAEILMK